MNYRPFIDGLRALAVLAVLFYHFDLGVPGGYVGVDIFFVISGYLITGIILKDLAHERFHIVTFWERRIRRILPMLALVVAVSLLLGWLLLFPKEYKKTGLATVMQSLMASNIYFCQAENYFANDTDIRPLLHTWSLAVEEQFYLFFPLLLWGLRRWSRPRLTMVLGIISLLSLGLSMYTLKAYPKATFYLLPMRAWELGVGAVLAALVGQRYCPPRWVAELGGGLGLLGILYAIFAYTSETPFPGWAALLPCVGTGLIIWANEQRATWVGKLLSWRGLVGIGLISYSLYLWHWPILAYTKYWFEPLSLPLRVGLLLGCLGLATLTWKYVETPFRQRRWFASRRHIFRFAGVTVGLIFVAGMLVRHIPRIPSPLIPVVVEHYATERGDNMLAVKGYQRTRADLEQGKLCALGADNPQQPVRLLVWGDSHALAVLPTLDAMCREYGVRGWAATQSGMAPLLGYGSRGRGGDDAGRYHAAILNYVRQNRIPNVLLVGKWIGYDDGTARLQRGFEQTIAAGQAAGATVWIMEMVPRHGGDVPRGLARNEILGRAEANVGWPVPDFLAAGRPQDEVIARLAAAGAKILDPKEYLLDAQQRCRVVRDGKALYFDTNHLTVTGTELLRPMFVPIFTGATAVPATRITP